MCQHHQYRLRVGLSIYRGCCKGCNPSHRCLGFRIKEAVPFPFPNHIELSQALRYISEVTDFAYQILSLQHLSELTLPVSHGFRNRLG